VVALVEGRPFVTSSSTVELWHARCWDVRDVPIVVAPKPTPIAIAPPRQAPRWLVGAVAASALAGVGFAHMTTDKRLPVGSLANLELSSAEAGGPHLGVISHEVVPARMVGAETALEARYEVPIVDGKRLDEKFPSLHGWVHPVTGSAELMPEQGSRHFGAQRIGIERAECGAGHCGVDLDGPRGRPIVSVASGVVVRVERSELGLDGRSGRYVRIQHDDGTLTAYMHLDDVADDLEVGNHVEGGQYIGTLGATAVYSAPPHLHFSVEIPRHGELHGDITDTRYVDPAPFLVRATIAKAPQRRHAIKPAF
jgi:murein DD-endopeptidase MepM/ murein hydrolase activator NlpD